MEAKSSHTLLGYPLLAGNMQELLLSRLHPCYEFPGLDSN
jgi:hypothetical protein